MPETCTVAAMIRYAQAADSRGWDISKSYLFPEMAASGDRTPKRFARPWSAKAMVARLKGLLGHAGLGTRQFTFHSFRVGFAATQTIAGKDIAEIIAAVSWKSENIARPYVLWEVRRLRGTPSGLHPAPRRHVMVRPTHWRRPWTLQCWPYFPREQQPCAESYNHRWIAPFQLRFLHTQINISRAYWPRPATTRKGFPITLQGGN